MNQNISPSNTNETASTGKRKHKLVQHVQHLQFLVVLIIDLKSHFVQTLLENVTLTVN